MKLLFFFLPLLLAIVVLRCTATQHAATTQLVYDTDGGALSSGSSYYIVPARPRNGGGLKYVPAAGMRCLNFVAQERRNATLPGTPLRFTRQPAVGAGEAVIRLSSDVAIEFHDHPGAAVCAGRLDWHLTTDHQPPGRPLPPRVAAGNEGGAIRSSSSKVFRIERHAIGGVSGYKLVSCADDDGGAAPPCRDLGLFFDKDETWLTVASDGREPFLVVFKKRHV